MRLGRTARLILGIGIFVIASATLFTVYSRQSSEQEELKNSLVGAGARLPKLISEREVLASQLTEQQNQLAAFQSSLNKSQASFPKLSENIEYDEVLAEIAHDCNLEIMGMKAVEPSEETTDNVTYMVLSFEVGVRGDADHIRNMVNAIATDGRLTSAGVEVVDVKPESSPTGVLLATIKLVGYSYRGE